MSIRLEIRPCWKYECPCCERVFRFPTSRSIKENGAYVVHRHLADAHPGYRVDTPVIQWEKDHMANLREP